MSLAISQYRDTPNFYKKESIEVVDLSHRIETATAKLKKWKGTRDNVLGLQSRVVVVSGSDRIGIVQSLSLLFTRIYCAYKIHHYESKINLFKADLEGRKKTENESGSQYGYGLVSSDSSLPRDLSNECFMLFDGRSLSPESIHGN
jgi:hypothetical protein